MIRFILLPIEILSMPETSLSSEITFPEPTTLKTEQEDRNRIKNRDKNIRR